MTSNYHGVSDHELMPEGEEQAPPLTGTMAIIRWCILGGMALFALVMALGFFGLAPFAQAGLDQSAQFHCPMHPTYISNQPGDCPICGMSLVPIGRDSTTVTTKESARAESAPHAKPGQYTCPMHPEVVSDTAGRCPICKMFLEKVPADTAAVQPTAKPGQFTCSMCPEVISDKPGECPKCGMDLELVPDSAKPTSPQDEHMHSASDVPGLVPVTIEHKRVRLIGLQTAVAERTSIGETKRLTGFVTVDETKLVHIHLRAGGWVTKALVVETGARVKAGEPLLVMYSQELFAASQEYVLARRGYSKATADTAVARQRQELVDAARYRLYYFGATADDVAQIDTTGTPLAELIVRSPVDGYVFEKAVNDGQYVSPDATLYTIADNSAVWVIADVYAQDMTAIQVGQSAGVTTESNSGGEIAARVVYKYPAVSEKTRTGKIRLQADDHERSLKPGMYVTVKLEGSTVNGITVPEDAVLDGGETQYLFVVHDSTHFIPRRVTTGRHDGGRIEILSGVKAGETVVTNANFLIDSESRLKAALTGMGEAKSQIEHHR